MPYWGGTVQDPIGIEHDFASGLAQELGVAIDYKEFDSVEALLEALNMGKADMVIGFAHTPDREGKFLFSEPLYENLLVIWLRDKNMAEKPLESLRWVCIQATSYCEMLKTRGYPNTVIAPNYTSSVEMIRQGVADATITNYVSLNHFLSQNRFALGKVVFDPDLGSQINRVLINRNEPLLLSAINKVIEADKNGLTKNKLNSSDIYFLNDQASLGILRNESINTVVRYTLQDDFFPISYFDEKNKQYKGYVHDLLERISAKSILKFEFVPAYGRDVEELLRDGKVDLIPFFNMNHIDDRDFIHTGKYSEVTFDYIQSLKPYTKKITAILDRTGRFNNYIAAQSNLTDVKVYRTIYDFEQALTRNEFTHGLVNRHLTDQMLTNGHQGLFKLSSLEEDPNPHADVTMLVRKDMLGLQNMLQRVLATFSQSEIYEIEALYDRVTVRLGYDKQQVLISTLVTLCVVLGIGLALTLSLSHLRTKLRSSEQVAQLSFGQLRWLMALLDAIPNMLFISDQKGEVILANAAYRNSYQACCNSECAQQRPECAFMGLPQEIDAEYSMVIQVPETYCAIGGCHFHVMRRAIYHPISQQQVYLTLFNDITELKQTEQALRDSNQQALQAVEARNHFMAVISHELRTPIAAMLGLMELLGARLKNSESQLLLTNAISSAERLKLHVNDILDFSKIEAQQLSLDIAQYNLADELGPLLRGFEASAQLKHVQFEVIWLPSVLLLANFDALRFNQIVTNLLSNALKFTELGRITVTIETTHESLTIAVEDTGCGMTQTQIESIFVPFVQADSTITRRFGGTGLGMSIVSNLIELMQGNIEIHSQLGQGTQIKVKLPITIEACCEFTDHTLALHERSPYLPWAQALGIQMTGKAYWLEQSSHNTYPDLLFNQLRSQVNSTSELAEWIEPHLLQGHILVADDDPINRLLLRKQLNEIGVSAMLVCDGQQAFDKLSTNPEQYDLLITDCHMPNLDGFTLTRKVRLEIPQFGGAIICCTAEDSRLAAEQAEQAGMDKVIYKPYSLATLRKTLAHYLTMQSVLAAPSAWLETYEPDERQEMASVVVDSFTQDIELLNQTDCDVKALAHRIKGAAGALQLVQLAELAKSVEKQNSPQQLVIEKQQLINAMYEIVEQGQQWLNQQQSE
ncbi:MAG: ATP-binding protein [Vibrio sp.]